MALATLGCLWAGLLVVLPPAVAAWAAAPPILPESLLAPNGGAPVNGSAGQPAGYLAGSWGVSPSGAFTYSVPLQVPAGRAGMAPSLAVTYSSSGANGPLGIGAALTGAGSVITRCGKTPLREGTRAGVGYGADDVFCLDGQKLVAVSGAYGGNQTEYRTEEESFAKIVSVTPGTVADGPDQFVVYAKDGRKQTYQSVRAVLMDESVELTDEGVDEQTGVHTSVTHLEQHSRAVAAPKVSWELVRDEDRLGNAVLYEYTSTLSPHGFERVLSRIWYTSGPGRAAARRVDFVYEDRPDWSFGYAAGVRYAQTKRLKTVQMFAPNPATTSLVYQYNLAYLPLTGTRTRSQLDRLQLCGAEGKAMRCLVAKKFTWANPALPSFTTTSLGPMPPQTTTPASTNEALRVGDFNGDGASDVIFNPGGAATELDDRIRLSRRDATTGAVVPLAQEYSLRNGDWPFPYGVPTQCWDGHHCPVPTTVRSARELDLDGDGDVEVVVSVTRAPDPDEDGGSPAHDTTRTKILRWDATANKFVDTRVELPLGDAADWSDFADVNGDGRLDRFYSRRVPATPGSSFDRSKVGVQLNSGTGFGPPTFIDMYAGCAHQVADTDGDGRGELLLERPWEPVPGGKLNCGNGHGTDAVKVADNGTMTRTHGGEGHEPFVRGEGWSLPFLSPQLLGSFLGGEVLYENDLGAYRNVLGDFNGDGLRDVLVVRRALEWGGGHTTFGGAFILWNSGRGLYYDKDAPPPNIPTDDLADLQVADFDSDGRDDVVSFHNTGLQLDFGPSWKPVGFHSTPGAEDRISIAYSDGRGGFQVDTRNTSAGRVAWNGAEFTRPFSRLGDFDADGRTDIIKNDGELKVMTQTGPVTDRIVAVSDEGTGWYRQEVTYSQAWTDHPEKIARNTCGLPSVCLRAGMTVVRMVKSQESRFNGEPGARSVYFSYDDPVSDTADGFVGFAVFRQWDPTTPSETVTTFDVRSLRGGTAVSAGYRPFAGLPRTITTVVPIKPGRETKQYPSANARVTLTVYDEPEFRPLNPLPGGGHASFAVFPTRTNVREFEVPATIDWTPDLTGRAATTHISAPLTGWPPFRQRTSILTHDDYGNLTDAIIDTQGGPNAQGGVDPFKHGVRVTTHTDYDLSPTRISDWLTGVPSRTSVTHLEPDLSEASRHTDFIVDGRGLPWITITAKDTPDEAQTTLGRDPVTGVVTSTTVSTAGLPATVSHTDYRPMFDGQPDEQIYPSMVWAEHDKPEYQPRVWQLVQPAYGVTVATMDVNGVTTGTTIDGLGRPVTTTSEQGPTTHHTYAPHTDPQGNLDGMVTTVAVDTDLTGTGKRNVSSTTTDQLGRIRAVSTTGFDGAPVLTGTGYDRLGNVAWQTRPYRAGEPIRQTVFDTDTLGRPLWTTGPDDATHRWAYPSPFTVQTTDPVGVVSTVTSDGDDRPVRSTRYTAGGGRSTNTVEYAPFGLPRKTIDEGGNATVFDYDALGRVRNVVDPDRGSVSTTYYGTGEVRTSTHHGTGEKSTYSYDDLGRLITAVDDGPAGQSTTSWTWDTAPHGIGRLAQDTSPDGITTTYSYDTYGRSTGMTVKDATGTGHSVSQTYDPLGRPDTLTYPATPHRPPLKIKNGYNPYGFHTTTSDVTGPIPRQLLNITSLNNDNAVTAATLTPTGAITLSRAYHPGNGRLTRSMAINSTTGVRLQDLTYTHYANGMVENRNQDDTAAVRDEHFTYDEFNRLTDWELTAGAAATTKTHYAFDAIGNLTDVTNSTGLTPPQHRTHGGPRPHAPITDTNPTGNGQETYQYDSAGRLEKVQDATGETRATTYTPFDLPRRITQKGGLVTTFGYNADGVRITESGPTGTMFTLPGLFQDRKDTNGRHTYVHYLPGIGQATYTDAGETFQYTLTDPLGSVTAVASETGTVTESRFYDPYGLRIKATGERLTAPQAGPVNTGFGGLEHDDELRMINNNGRVYDPAAKLFQSPDPVLANHPYNHTNNNPINYSDPTGFDPCDPHITSCYVDDQVGTPGGSDQPVPMASRTRTVTDGGTILDGHPLSTGTAITGDARSDSAGHSPGHARGNAELIGGSNGPNPFFEALKLAFALATKAVHIATDVVMGLLSTDADVPGMEIPRGMVDRVDPLAPVKKEIQVVINTVMAADTLVTPFLSGGGSALHSTPHLTGATSPYSGVARKTDGRYAITHGTNPNNLKYNCAPASVAGIKRLTGKDVKAANLDGKLTDVEIEIAAIARRELGNAEEASYRSLKDVVNELRQRGPGSAAVVTEILHGQGFAIPHSTTAFHDYDGAIRFFDFQNGRAASYLSPAMIREFNSSGLITIIPEYHTVFVRPIP